MRSRVPLKSRFMASERGERAILETMHSILTIGRDRSAFPELILDMCNAHIYFFDFIPMPSARAAAPGLCGNYIRSRRMFLLRIIARATTPIFPLFFYSSVHHPLPPRILWLPLATLHFPVKFRRCSLKSVLTERISRPSSPSFVVYNPA